MSSLYPAQGSQGRYYILRETKGSMVPLIPVDQLPFQLQGIPLRLTHRQLAKEGWTFVDEIAEPASILPVSKPSPGPATSKLPHHMITSRGSNEFRAPDARIQDEASKSREPFRAANVSQRWIPVLQHVVPSQSDGQIARSRHPVAAIAEEKTISPSSLDNIYAGRDAKPAIHHPRLPPSGIEPDPSRKEFCTHWIKTGECAFTVVGCKYKHAMPDPEKLRELGFNGVPRWYKEKTALESRGPTWMQRRAALAREQAARKNEEVVVKPKRAGPIDFARLRLEDESEEEGGGGGGGGRAVSSQSDKENADGRSRKAVHDDSRKVPVPPIADEMLIDLDISPETPAAEHRRLPVEHLAVSPIRYATSDDVPRSHTRTSSPSSARRSSPRLPSRRQTPQYSDSSDEEAVRASKLAVQRRVGRQRSSRPVLSRVAPNALGSSFDAETLEEGGLAQSRFAAA